MRFSTLTGGSRHHSLCCVCSEGCPLFSFGGSLPGLGYCPHTHTDLYSPEFWMGILCRFLEFPLCSSFQSRTLCCGLYPPSPLGLPDFSLMGKPVGSAWTSFPCAAAGTLLPWPWAPLGHTSFASHLREHLCFLFSSVWKLLLPIFVCFFHCFMWDSKSRLG